MLIKLFLKKNAGLLFFLEKVLPLRLKLDVPRVLKAGFNA